MPKLEFRKRFYRSCHMRVRLGASRMIGAGPRFAGANGTGSLARLMASALRPTSIILAAGVIFLSLLPVILASVTVWSLALRDGRPLCLGSPVCCLCICPEPSFRTQEW